MAVANTSCPPGCREHDDNDYDADADADGGVGIQDLARVQLSDDRFVQVPLRAMAKHIQVRDEDGWYSACTFLRSLAHQTDEKKVALCQQGAVTTLQHSMQVFRASARVLTVAISCLHVLAFVEDNRQPIGQPATIGLVVDALRQHVDNTVLALCGCRLLQMIALNDEFKPDLLRAGAVDVACGYMAANLTPDLASQCCGFFYFLADQVDLFFRMFPSSLAVFLLFCCSFEVQQRPKSKVVTVLYTVAVEIDPNSTGHNCSASSNRRRNVDGPPIFSATGSCSARGCGHYCAPL